ncbi:lactonase family protein [Plantibacter sp. PA-3-X8]|nr:lactonase family protein [Plantibacter sp. PA-3-X8]
MGVSDDNPYLLLGSYTSEADGTGAGISLLRQDEAGTLRLVQSSEAQSPSFLTLHPTLPIVYAASESTGAVEAFKRSGEFGLAPFGKPIEAGDSVCHVATVPGADILIASCYGDGRVVTVPLAENAAFAGDPRLGEASVDPWASPTALAAESADAGEDALTLLALEAAVDEALPSRPSRAHASALLPDGRIATTDLGHDTVRIWQLRGSRLVLDHTVVFPRGTGPRHLVVHPSGHLHVITEYSVEVFTLGVDGTDGHWHMLAATVATSEGVSEGDTGAEISLAASREQLHVGVRGSDRIATLRVTGDGSRVEAVADVECGGTMPRHHRESGRFLHVANQLSNSIASFRLDERTGVPTTLLGTLDAGSPTCLILA